MPFPWLNLMLGRRSLPGVIMPGARGMEVGEAKSVAVRSGVAGC